METIDDHRLTMQHRNLAAGRWSELSLIEQLGNVGSEVGRAASWQARGDAERFEGAFARMLELLDLTLADARWAGARRKELARVREALCDSFEGGALTGIHPASWDAYFMPFALAARSGR